MVYGQEADDALGIAQTADTCIVSIDKDLLQIPGVHYHFVKKEFYNITPDQGLRHFYMQLLMGDRIDNIPGVYGIGPVNAKRILSKCNTEEEMYHAVVAAYGGRTDEVLRNGRLLKIRTREGEIWNPPISYSGPRKESTTGSDAADRGLTSAGEQTIGVPS
jgi:5'-3' exonuclease